MGVIKDVIFRSFYLAVERKQKNSHSIFYSLFSILLPYSHFPFPYSSFPILPSRYLSFSIFFSLKSNMINESIKIASSVPQVLFINLSHFWSEFLIPSKTLFTGWNSKNTAAKTRLAPVVRAF